MSINRNIFFLPALLCLLSSAAIAQVIPLDSALRTGKLPNGFTYYIRRNTAPQHRVQLYLVNNVGSLLEEQDQQGLAHFMEHMNFNGTTHFPKNELVDYLQKAGVKFGTDLNAYTNFDETVYQLPIPTDDPQMLNNGLKIIRDWAQEALLDSIEIDKERGVVLEEERLGKGANERMLRKYYPVLLNHSRYAERIPIGIHQVLTTFKPAAIRRFHDDWYRPDLQALIVVGDIDVNAVEKEIIAQFASLKNPVDEKLRPVYKVPLTGHNQFISVTDPEMATEELQVIFKHKAEELQTEADYRNLIKRNLFNQMMGNRVFAETSQEKNPSFISTNAGISDLMGGLDMFSFNVIPKIGQTADAFKQAWSFVEKVKRFGFTQEELDRAKQSYNRTMQDALAEKSKIPSLSFVKEYQDLFLHHEASPGIQWEADFVNRNLHSISLADVNSVTGEYLTSRDMDVLMLAPEKDKNSLPDSAAVMNWIRSSANVKIPAFENGGPGQPLMAVYPQAGKVVTKKELPGLGITLLTLSNGVKVVLKPTDFKNIEIRFAAFSAGGTSLYEGADFDNATNAAVIINRSGVAGFNPARLSALLNDKEVTVSTAITSRKESVNGTAAPADLETALQLIYLRFTKPRKDSVLFKNIVNNARDLLANRYAEPTQVFNDTINNVLGNYTYRSSPPTAERLDKLSLDKIYHIYQDRFADASGFTFVFTGNFKPAAITPLLEQYLGALPSLQRKETAVDRGIHIPEGQITKIVYKGTENKATVSLVFSGEHIFNPGNNLLLKAIGEILQIKLLQQIREEESEVYSPIVQTVYNKLPRSQYSLIVAFGCAPKNSDHLIAMVMKEVESLKDKGPELADVQKFKAAYQKNMELALHDNAFWTDYLIGQYENNEQASQVLNYQHDLELVTPESLKIAVREFLTGKNLIRFELLPEVVTTDKS